MYDLLVILFPIIILYLLAIDEHGYGVGAIGRAREWGGKVLERGGYWLHRRGSLGGAPAGE